MTIKYGKTKKSHRAHDQALIADATTHAQQIYTGGEGPLGEAKLMVRGDGKGVKVVFEMGLARVVVLYETIRNRAGNYSGSKYAGTRLIGFQDTDERLLQPVLISSSK